MILSAFCRRRKKKQSFFLKTEKLRLVKEFYSKKKKKDCILTTSKEIDKRMNYEKKKNTKRDYINEQILSIGVSM